VPASFITRILRHCNHCTRPQSRWLGNEEARNTVLSLSFSRFTWVAAAAAAAWQPEPTRHDETNDTARYRSPRREPETFHVPFALALLSNDVYYERYVRSATTTDPTPSEHDSRIRSSFNFIAAETLRIVLIHTIFYYIHQLRK